MIIEHQSVVYDASTQPEDTRIAYFTSLCPLASDTLLAAFQVGRVKHATNGTTGLCRSRDGGRSWQRIAHRFSTELNGVPGSLTGGELVEVEPGHLLLFTTWFDRSDPDRPLFDPTTEGILRSRQLVARSHDEGETWSDWEQLAVGSLTGTALTGPVVRWPDGTFAFAFESFKEFDDPSPPRHGAWILVSRDGGRTFSAPLLVAQDPRHETYYWDQRLCPGPQPGQFVALFWTHDRRQQKDLNVHLAYGQLEGPELTMSSIYETPIRGQIAAPCWLADGRLLAFVVDRSRPATMTLWSSPDGGKSWPQDDRLVVYHHEEQAPVTQGSEHIDFAQYWEDMGKWSFGHPAIRPLDTEHVLVAWYAGTPTAMSIHAARVRTTT